MSFAVVYSIWSNYSKSQTGASRGPSSTPCLALQSSWLAGWRPSVINSSSGRNQDRGDLFARPGSLHSRDVGIDAGRNNGLKGTRCKCGICLSAALSCRLSDWLPPNIARWHPSEATAVIIPTKSAARSSTNTTVWEWEASKASGSWHFVSRARLCLVQR